VRANEALVKPVRLGILSFDMAKACHAAAAENGSQPVYADVCHVGRRSLQYKIESASPAVATAARYIN
jgi:hypothetical protein